MPKKQPKSYSEIHRKRREKNQNKKVQDNMHPVGSPSIKAITTKSKENKKATPCIHIKCQMAKEIKER